MLGVAAAVVVGELRPAPPPTTPVVVAARELPAGTVLQAGDLRVARVHPGMVPDGAPQAVPDVVGRRLSTGVPARLPLVPTVLAESGWSAAAPSGTVVVPVRLADPAVAALLQPGDVIDVLAAGGSDAATSTEARRVAHRAIVLDTPSAESGGLLGLGTGAPQDGVAVLAVRPDEATTLAGTLGWAALTAVLVQ